MLLYYIVLTDAYSATTIIMVNLLRESELENELKYVMLRLTQ